MDLDRELDAGRFDYEKAQEHPLWFKELHGSRTILDTLSLIRGPWQRVLDDMLMLAKRFAAIADTDIIDIRIDRLKDDACWKFHRDQVRLRLLATYRGPLEDLPEGAVALFKGARAGPDQGIVHRSPPVAGTGMVRSLLCLNLPTDTSPRLWQP